MTRELRFFRLWLGLGLLACAVLAYVCLMPNPPQPDVSHFDKFEHVLAYCVLGAWFAAILPRRYLWVCIGLASLGGAIEVLQSLSGYRSGDVLDMVADIIGIVAGLACARAGLMRWLYHIDKHAFPKRNRT